MKTIHKLPRKCYNCSVAVKVLLWQYFLKTSLNLTFQKMLCTHTGLLHNKMFKCRVWVPFPHRKSPFWSATGPHGWAKTRLRKLSLLQNIHIIPWRKNCFRNLRENKSCKSSQILHLLAVPHKTSVATQQACI